MAQPRDFGFGEDEQLLRDSARKFLAEHANVEKLRALVASDHKKAYESEVQPVGFDEAAWKQAIELGWTTLAVPEEAGGAGMSMTAVAALCEEAGRHAWPSPLLPTLWATFVLRRAKTDAAKAWLGRIAEGESATLAVTAESGSWEPGDAPLSDEGGKLNGTAWFVQDARKARFVVAGAKCARGVALYAVPLDTAGVTVKPDRIVDLTRDQARVEFTDVKVSADQKIAECGEGEKVLAAAIPAILVTLAADMCGAGEWQLQTTSEYAKVREQFGRPIGFFQAVKHPIVNMMCAVDEARSLLYNAAASIDHDDAEAAERNARLAKASASEMADYCSGRSVQFHGGIGFTWESDLHLYFKRQYHSRELFGNGDHQRAKLAPLYEKLAGGGEAA